MISDLSRIMIKTPILIEANPIIKMFIIDQVDLRWKPKLDIESFRALHLPAYRERLIGSSTLKAVFKGLEIYTSLSKLFSSVQATD